MFALLKKQVLTDVVLKDPSELTAIVKLARFGSEKLDIASQELRAGFLASEVQGPCVIDDHIALTHASSSAIKRVEVLLMTLAAPVAWGEDAHIDTLVAVIVPDEADSDAAVASVQAKLQALACTTSMSAGALEKLRRQL